MALILNGTTGISGTNALTGVTGVNSGQIGGRRNIVYNGEMKVAQRSASVTGIGATSGYFTLDRWYMFLQATAGRLTMAQVADGPAGFANCMKLTTTTADTSIAAGERLQLLQVFEGQDLQQLKKGTSSAEAVTVSFYVKANAAALYVCELLDSDGSRMNTQSFAVTTDWNRIELTFVGDTASAIVDDNTASLYLSIWLHGGSTFTGGTFASNTWAASTAANRFAVANRTSIFDATSRTFFITGVQMELGSKATSFESRSFGEELALCQRYLYKSQGTHAFTAHGLSSVFAVNQTDFITRYPVSMRAIPTMSKSGTIYGATGNRGEAINTFGDVGGSTTTSFIRITLAASDFTIGECLTINNVNDAAAFIQFEAEL